MHATAHTSAGPVLAASTQSCCHAGSLCNTLKTDLHSACLCASVPDVAAGSLLQRTQTVSDVIDICCRKPSARVLQAHEDVVKEQQAAFQGYSPERPSRGRGRLGRQARGSLHHMGRPEARQGFLSLPAVPSVWRCMIYDSGLGIPHMMQWTL